MVDIVVAGELITEFVAVDKGQSFAVPGSFKGPFPSGAPAIFADQAAQMGVSVSYIGCVGNDAFGEAIVERLKNHNVNVEHIRYSNRPTALAFVAYKEDGSRQFVYSIEGSATSTLGPSDVDASIFSGCRYLHVMGSSLNNESSIATIRKAMLEAQKVGAKISFDPNIRQEMLSFAPMHVALNEVLEQCHLFLPSEADLAFFCGNQSTEKSIHSLLHSKANLERIVLKLGDKGSVYFDKDKTWSAPSFNVTEIDPTGAGDCFGGTLVACLVKNEPIEKALRYANAAGAMAVSKIGPMEGNSSYNEIKNFINQ
ncbi:Tagatose kinase [Commensalibacter sp. Nvir]|uniref:sugar kinase n=1 Tax=Commensalibacter sp. Nvir TaxID=3069817 RepID=UPI002D432595|nr:Tagatose kinase [Commensalibacter sp. Nvir]